MLVNGVYVYIRLTVFTLHIYIQSFLLICLHQPAGTIVLHHCTKDVVPELRGDTVGHVVVLVVVVEMVFLNVLHDLRKPGMVERVVDNVVKM